MRLHEREKIVREAKLDLSGKLLEWMQTWNGKLTFAEEMQIVGGELGDQVTRAAKYAIRRERHGSEDHAGGLANDPSEVWDRLCRAGEQSEGLVLSSEDLAELMKHGSITDEIEEQIHLRQEKEDAEEFDDD